jgi:hypothetical protein
MSGNHNISYDGETRLGVLRAKNPAADVLTVGWQRPIKVDEWTVHEGFVTIADFAKDGSYKIKPSAPGGQLTALENNVYLIVYRFGADGKPTDAARYEFPVKGCDVRVAKQGDEGSITCPELAHNDGKAIRFEATWKMTGAHEDESTPTSTTTAAS